MVDAMPRPCAESSETEKRQPASPSWSPESPDDPAEPTPKPYAGHFWRRSTSAEVRAVQRRSSASRKRIRQLFCKARSVSQATGAEVLLVVKDRGVSCTTYGTPYFVREALELGDKHTGPPATKPALSPSSSPSSPSREGSPEPPAQQRRRCGDLPDAGDPGAPFSVTALVADKAHAETDAPLFMATNEPDTSDMPWYDAIYHPYDVEPSPVI